MKKHFQFKPALALAAFLVVTAITLNLLVAPAYADNFTITAAYPDFSSTYYNDSFQLNGDATLVDPNLRLTRATGNEFGSAFRKLRVVMPNDYAFSVYFTFWMDNGSSSPADGIAFCIQTAGNNVGSTGEGIGYGGVSPSFCVEYDTYENAPYDPDDNHIGASHDGVYQHSQGYGTVTPGVDMNDGTLYHSWIDYNGSTVEVRLATTNARPSSATYTASADLDAVFDTSDVYFGFTAATGMEYQEHWIGSFYFDNQYNPIDTSTHTYDAGPASIVVTADPSTLGASETTTITAHVTDELGAVMDGETVNFTTTDGTLSESSAVTDSNGDAIVTLTGPGTIVDATVRAEHAGGVYGETVVEFIRITTDTELTSSANPSKYGQAITFTADVTAPQGTPDGTVTFKMGGVDIPGCVDVALVGGQATCDPGVLDVGTYVITADYAGSAMYFPSSDGLDGDQAVEAADTTTGVTSSANPSMYGTLVTFTATVTTDLPGMGMPVGTVSFYDGPTLLQTSSLDEHGQAAFTTVYPLAVGSHKIYATYSGSDNFNASASPVLLQRVEWATDLSIEKTIVNPRISDLTFVIVARNRSCCCIAAPGAIISDTLPTYYHNATWLCEADQGAECGARSGEGHIYDTLGAFPPGGVVTYTLHAEFDLPAEGFIRNTAEIIPPVGVSDIDLSNERATVNRWIVLLPVVSVGAVP